MDQTQALIEKMREKKKEKEKKERDRIVKTAKMNLFQIPFTKDQIFSYQCKTDDHFLAISNCLLQTLTLLGLRDYTSATEDQKRLDQMYTDPYDRGIHDCDVSNYLSTIFDSDITDSVHYDKLDLVLKEGYATLVTVKYYKNKINTKYIMSKFKIDDRRWGTSFVVYKHKGKIYWYDPCTETNTVSLKKLMTISKTTNFENYTCFYTDKKSAVLHKNRLIAPIRY